MGSLQLYWNDDFASELFRRFLTACNITTNDKWTVQGIVIVLNQSHLDLDVKSALKNGPKSMQELFREVNAKTKANKAVDDKKEDIKASSNCNKDKNYAPPHLQENECMNNSAKYTRTSTEDSDTLTSDMIPPDDQTLEVTDIKESLSCQDGLKDQDGQKDRLLIIIKGNKSNSISKDLLKKRYSAVEVIEILYAAENPMDDLGRNSGSKKQLQAYVYRACSQRPSAPSENSKNVLAQQRNAQTTSCIDGSDGRQRKVVEFNILYDEKICKTAFCTFMNHYLEGYNPLWNEKIISEKNHQYHPTLLLCFTLSRLEEDINATLALCCNKDTPAMLVIIHPCYNEHQMKSIPGFNPVKPVIAYANILYNSRSSECSQCDTNKEAAEKIRRFLGEREAFQRKK